MNTEIRRHLQRLLQRYMRRRADRLIGGPEVYTDLAIGPAETRRNLGLDPGPHPQLWLDALGVPDTEAIDIALRDAPPIPDDDPSERLRVRFSLSPLERDVLLAVAAPTMDLDLSRAYCVAWADQSIKQPTVAFIAELIAGDDDTARRAVDRAFLAGSTLRRAGLLRATPHPRWAGARLHAHLEVSQKVVDFLLGLDLSDALSGIEALSLSVAPDSSLVIPDDARRALEEALSAPNPRLRLRGIRGIGRRTAVDALTNRPLIVVDLEALCVSRDPREARGGLEKALLIASLYDATLLLRFDDALMLAENVLDILGLRLRAHLDQARCGIVLTHSEPHSVLARWLPEAPELTLRLPDIAAQRRAWAEVLTHRGCDESRATDLAAHVVLIYQIPVGAIHRAVDAALDVAGAPEALDIDTLLKHTRRQLRHRLESLGDAIAPNLGLNDVVLPPEVREQVEEVIQYAQHSETVFQRWGFDHGGRGGRGLSVMFSGPPGTGKTLVASVLARTLGRVLYRVDLSRIVDKYIGETEKNLARIFDEAERAQAVLLFDEADSLFAKRTTVRSSNDRYANLEVNFLLQRLESYDGVSILTTNLATSIDEAFQRRIRFKIEFPIPGVAERGALWHCLLPPHAPRAEDIDFEALGEDFVMSGGHIRNAVLRSAIRAAQLGRPIDHEGLHEAAVAESRDMGSLVATWE